MAEPVDILAPVPLQPLILAGLEGRFRLHRLWSDPDPHALLARVAPQVRAVVTAVPILADGVSAPVDAAFIARLPKLELIANLGVGYDNIDVAAAAARGVVVTNTPDVLTEETADTAFGLLLNAVREFPAAERYLRAGHWPTAPFRLTASLRGRRLGILGLGRIGRAIARRAEGFGLAIAYHNRRPVADAPWPYYPTPLALAQACDLLMVVVPGGAETKHIVNAAVLEALGPTGIVVNIARGSAIDEAALIAALRERRIAGAGLDVFEHEPQVPDALLAMDHVTLLPHVGSASHATRDAMSQLVVDNVIAWSEGRRPPTPVAETPVAETPIPETPASKAPA